MSAYQSRSVRQFEHGVHRGVGVVRSDVVVPVILVWLLAGPRLNLVTLGNSSIRLEDLILVAVGVWGVFRSGVRQPERLIVTAVAAVSVASVAAAFVSAYSGRTAIATALLYALRPLEYWLIFPAVQKSLANRPKSARQNHILALQAITVLQAVFALVQAAGVQIGFSDASYTRSAGLTAGPYELGAVCAALMCFWIAQRRFLLLGISAVTLVLSQSRISLAAAVSMGGLLLMLELVRRVRRGRGSPSAQAEPVARPRMKPSTIIVWTLAIAGLVAVGPQLVGTLFGSTASRLSSTAVSEAWQEGGDLAATSPRSSTAQEYYETAYLGYVATLGDSEFGDDSSLIRFWRWQLLIRETSASLDREVLGMGPSFAGPSVDGALLRVWVETGAVGVAAWAFLAFAVLRRSAPWMAAVVVTLVVGSLFIDLLYAMRPMLLVWALLGLGLRSSTSVRHRAGAPAFESGMGGTAEHGRRRSYAPAGD